MSLGDVDQGGGGQGLPCERGLVVRGWGSSVVCDRSELGVQVHCDVLVETAEGDVGAVVEVVEAIQVLPFLGIPQQFIPAKHTATQISHQSICP